MESTDGRAASAFDGYVEALIEVIGHADRAVPLRDYCTGLMMPVARKSVKPLAAVTAPTRVSAKHQSLLYFVGQAPWSDEALMGRGRDWVLPHMVERGGPITAWIVDDTGCPKKEKHSVGVARQYCGQLGKQDNCQVAVSLSVANDGASLPVAWQLYLPESWLDDPERRQKAKIPDEIVFQTKPQIAIDQIRAALTAQTPVGVALADAGYGADGRFRQELTDMGARLLGRRPADTQRLASGRRAAATQNMEWQRPAAQAGAAQQGSQAVFRQGACRRSAGRCVEDRYMARGDQCRAGVTLCCRATACRFQRL
ncbi:DDE superfamily endonuclease [Paracoccus saliphilus]|uniref:DDE superfamily endonuclease n=1 Tax=Paracoccus saliphilus TaxID=405559 RepID=A0AA45W898_9RHOB|nr:DDE superfamily endonuclease [Paracoccus saliphilus]